MGGGVGGGAVGRCGACVQGRARTLPAALLTPPAPSLSSASLADYSTKYSESKPLALRCWKNVGSPQHHLPARQPPPPAWPPPAAASLAATTCRCSLACPAHSSLCIPLLLLRPACCLLLASQPSPCHAAFPPTFLPLPALMPPLSNPPPFPHCRVLTFSSPAPAALAGSAASRPAGGGCTAANFSHSPNAGVAPALFRLDLLPLDLLNQPRLYKTI